MSVLVYPLIDTIRVFSLRILRGKSPLLADKNHIHHHLSKLGLSHTYSVFILYFYTLIIIALQFLFQLYFNIEDPTLIFSLQLGSSMLIIAIIFFFKKNKTQAL